MDFVSGFAKDLAASPALQALVVTVVGSIAKSIAAQIGDHAPDSPKAKAVLHIVVLFLSLVMGFLQQLMSGSLDTFDPKPWQDFVTTLMASWGLLWGAGASKDKVKLFLNRG